VNPQEALRVNEIFERYLEMRSAYKLADFLKAQGEGNKRWVNRLGVESGGQHFSYQALYKILNNPLYIGRISHKDKTYEGQHQAIISIELWDQVQASLKEGRELRARRHAKHGALLMGKCYSPAGEVYTPTYSKSKGVQHRYYLQQKTKHRIKARDLESLVIDTIRLLAHEPKHWRACWSDKSAASDMQQRWEQLWAGWNGLADERRQEIVRQVIERITITKDQLTVRLSHAGITGVLDEVEGKDAPQTDQREMGYRPSVVQGDGYLEIIIPARFEVYGRTQLALDADGRPIRAFKKSNYNPVLVNALVKSYRWNRQLESGQVTITDLAKQERRDRTYVSRVVNLMYLAPEIISSILTGTQPATMHLQDLTANLPVEWHRQKQLLKFPASGN
jgi:hypothetical protein